jgi:DNA-binding transcriptional LysR family regulator
VELAWRDAPSNTLLAELRSGQIDMAVAAITEPPGGLTCIDLFRDPLVLVVRRDHALAAAGDANWEAIGKERLVLFERGSMPALGNPARAQFAQGPEPYRVSYSETLYALVRSGQALGLMPRLYTSSLRDPELVVVPLLKPRVERRVVLAYLPGPMRNVVAQELIAFLRERLPEGAEATVRRVTKGTRGRR